MRAKSGLFGGLLALLLVAAAGARAAERRDIFSVTVPVDATAADANAARDAARQGGERRAYAELLQRLTLAADRARLPRANDALLNDLVAGFEVAHERRSGVRYLADYTFNFRPEPVRRLLRQAGIPFAETASKPVVVLALFDPGSGPVLWEDPNPWREAWANRAGAGGLVPLILPLGELEDVAAIDAEGAASGDPARLAPISQRYGGADVLLARAALQGDAAPHKATVTSARIAPDAPSGTQPQSWTGTYTAASGESDGDLLARAAAATEDQLEEAWKSANLVDFSHTGTLSARVPAGSIEDWLAVRDRLAAIRTIQRSELLALDRQGARVAIHYFGDPGQLRVALAQHDLVLDGADPDWVLARRGSAAPPR